MPWKESNRMEQRQLLLADYLSGDYTITELSVIYNVSRKTVYKWINRYKQRPESWQNELSRAPHNHPNQISSTILDLLLETKSKHLSWGPKKIIQYLQNHYPMLNLPCVSTAGNWLKKYGFVKKRKIRKQVPPYTQPFGECNKSNKIWSIDYKGQFRLKNGKYCYPLTITDNYSRYLLCCQALPSTNYDDCKLWLDWTFEKYGLPDAIRSDNGIPFCTTSRTGLTRFSIYLIQLGIKHERIKKGCPQQNGRHERMHRTLKAEACKKSQIDFNLQQKIFNDFIIEYNCIRPHEALKGKTPKDVHKKNKRRLPMKILKPVYNKELMETRYVHPSGEISVGRKMYFVSESLGKETVVLKIIGDGLYEVYYYNKAIALIDKNKKIIMSIDKKKDYNL